MSSSNVILAFSLCLVCVSWFLIKPIVRSSSLDEIDGPPRQSLVTGNLKQMFGLYTWDWHWSVVRKYGGVIKLHGWFGEKWIYVSDPKALHAVIVKDQHIFEGTPFTMISRKLIFGESLLSTTGDHHRQQRKSLNPVFSINNMREIIPIFYPITHKLRDTLTSQIKRGTTEVDVLYWISRAALEYIGQAGIGYSFDNLDELEPQNPYTRAAKEFVPTLIRLNMFRQWIPVFVKLGPPRFLRFLVKLVPLENVQKVIKVIDTMSQTAEDVYKDKKGAFARGDEALVRQVGHGKDIMSVLMRENDLASDQDRLPEAEIIAQMNMFLFAASDTTSSALARILWVLADHPDMQEQVRREVTGAREAYGDLMYDELTNLPYLDAVCRETLRLYAPISTLPRYAREDTILPLHTPIPSRCGKLLHEVAVPKGTYVLVGIAAANRDPTIWGPDAEEWRPERWLGPLPASVDEAHLPGVYSNMMTFLGGGRACIGFKFSQLEMKVVLSVLLESFRFSPSDKEIVWTMPSISSPTTKGNEKKTPHLPLKVSLVR